jgi:hypothetical protein
VPINGGQHCIHRKRHVNGSISLPGSTIVCVELQALVNLGELPRNRHQTAQNLSHYSPKGDPSSYVRVPLYAPSSLQLFTIHTPFPNIPQKLYSTPLFATLASQKMGRPLFSASYSNPAVRTEPEIAPPAFPFEKWTRWNAFDPDSDEFFQRADAVYEAFLDSADVQLPPENRVEGGDEVLETERLEALIVRELEESESDSSASSEGTISGRGSPMAVGSDDPAGTLVNAYGPGVEPRLQTEAGSDNAGQGANRQSIDVEYWSTTEDLSMPPLRYADDSVPVTTTQEFVNERRISRVVPPLSPFRSRGFIPYFPRPFTRPITPPHPHDQNQDDVYITHEQTSPSPAPTVTPRLYSWSSRAPLGRGEPGSPSPLQRQRPRPGPLTNPSARMSLAHISPAPVRVRMA